MNWGPIQLRQRSTRKVVFTGEASPPPGGGSMPGQAYTVGPYHVNFTDIVNAGDTKDLFTIPDGHLLLTWWVNTDTAIPASPSPVDLGQGDNFPAGGQLGGLDGAQGAADGEYGVAQADSQRFSYDNSLFGNSSLLVPQDSSPVKVSNDSTATLTAGAWDIYFLLCTAPEVI